MEKKEKYRSLSRDDNHTRQGKGLEELVFLLVQPNIGEKKMKEKATNKVGFICYTFYVVVLFMLMSFYVLVSLLF